MPPENAGHHGCLPTGEQVVQSLNRFVTSHCTRIGRGLSAVANYFMKSHSNRTRAIPTTEAPSVSREDIVPSTSRNISASETTEQLPFRILDETFKSFPKFNTTGRSLLMAACQVRVMKSCIPRQQCHAREYTEKRRTF